MEEDVQEEEAPLRIPAQFRDLKAEKQDWKVRRLWREYMDGKLHLQAEFQRKYVWDDTRASRFIESLLLNLPVPPIFLAENQDGTWDVVDGHQRLESLFGFLQPLSEGPAQSAQIRPAFRSLRLKNLEVLHEELGSATASALPRQDRQALLERQIGVITIPKTANRDLRFVLFARLNLGSVPLNPQELRNCIYRGRYNDLIRKVAEDPEVLSLLGMLPHKRMRDRELVLRFFAFSHRMGQYRTPLRVFLNDEMEANQHCSFEQIEDFRTEFDRAMKWTTRVFENESCHLFREGSVGNQGGRWDRWTDLIYEVEMVGFCGYGEQLDELITSGTVQREDFIRALRHHLVGVMVGENFLRTLSEGTTRQKHVQLRHELWNGALASALEYPDAVCDRVSEIAAAVQRNALCGHCMTPVASLDDAERSVERDSVAIIVHRSCRKARLAQ